MEFSDLIRKYADEMGLGGVDQLVSDGMCVLDFGGTGVTLAVHNGTNKLVMCAEIAPVPSEGQAVLSLMMMKEMFSGGVSIGTVFSIDASSGTYCLHRCDFLNLMDFESFKRTLADFVAAVDSWRSRVGEFRPKAEDALEDGLNAPYPSDVEIIRA